MLANLKETRDVRSWEAARTRQNTPVLLRIVGFLAHYQSAMCRRILIARSRSEPILFLQNAIEEFHNGTRRKGRVNMQSQPAMPTDFAATKTLLKA